MQDSAFTFQDGLISGLSEGQLRHPRFIRMSRGICAVQPAELDLASRVRPFTRVIDSSAASHDTAARLWDFPEPVRHRFDRRIHISRPSGGARMQRPGVMGHRSGLLPEEVVYVDGICVTTRTRTWLDLAETLDLDDLVVIADYLVRIPRPAFEGRAEPYATQKELQGMLRRHPGKRGLRKAREALSLARVGADSPPETRLRLAMARAGLPEPAVNQPIRNEDGDILHRPDLSLPEYRIAIEYDGEGHGDSGQIARDIEREERARAADWDEVRISKRHMANGARRAVEKISVALRARGWRQEDAA
ncbi:hypothetical protein [Arthrobacter sp. NPDC089319]|uniref:endonuclease domain-containing protein n=1 Tax=Arthrobacter sp. NPDC089319 TaxID=3155915 RepID=UPI003416A735